MLTYYLCVKVLLFLTVFDTVYPSKLPLMLAMSCLLLVYWCLLLTPISCGVLCAAVGCAVNTGCCAWSKVLLTTPPGPRLQYLFNKAPLFQFSFYDTKIKLVKAGYFLYWLNNAKFLCRPVF